jgi:hypothetical protein
MPFTSTPLPLQQGYKSSSDTSRAPNFLMRILQLPSNRMGLALSAALAVEMWCEMDWQQTVD